MEKKSEEKQMNFKKKIEQYNNSRTFGTKIGVKVLDLKEGYAKAVMPIDEDGLNPHGTVHGGCIFTLADIAGGFAASSHGGRVVTVDSNLHYLNAGIDTKEMIAEARELKAGKRILTYEVSIMDQDNKVLADGIFTYMNLGESDGDELRLQV